MISKNLAKLVRSLEQKKYRRKERLFVAEGTKTVHDLMTRLSPARIIAVSEWYRRTGVPEDVVATADELRRISFVQHPQEVMALFPLPDDTVAAPRPDDGELVLALDDVQDPGNLGTIIRVADWFGISRVFCSRETVDAFSPKVVQATMGSIARVDLHYVDLPQWLSSLGASVPVYGTFLDGQDLYARELSPGGVIVMGNEGNGISPRVAESITRRLFIPPFPGGRDTAESLNVAIATAVVCAEFRRRMP